MSALKLFGIRKNILSHTLATLLSFFSVYDLAAQKIAVHGTVRDTVEQKSLQNAVVMGLRLSDSLLIAYTRSDAAGKFHLDSMPVDTYQIVISHPRFGDNVFIVLP